MKVQVKTRRLPQARDRPLAKTSPSHAITSHRDAKSRRNGEQQPRSLVWFTDAGGYDDLTCSGYTSLAQSPEIVTGVNCIARLVGAMTIYLMKNLPTGGDVRQLNGLSRLVDIEPNRFMNRSNFIQWIVRTLYLDGGGNAVVWPRTRDGYLQELVPIPLLRRS